MPASARQHAEALRQIEIQDDIAVVRTQQMEVDLEIEHEKLDRRRVKLDGEKIQTDTDRQRNIALGYGLDKAKIEADIAATGVQDAAVRLGIAGDNLLALEAQRGVNQSILMGRHRLLEIQAAELSAEVDQRSGITESLLGMLPSFDDLEMPAIEGGIE
jgi:hypothetical protein